MAKIERIVASPGFVVGLAVLLTNDLVLKPAFHNFLTGKLSDIAGIWLASLFLSAVFQKRFDAFMKHVVPPA